MKTSKEILGLYGKCCVTEYVFEEITDYQAGKQGEKMMRQDRMKLENIKGQKKAIEWLFE